ncbi:MAG: methyltransferase [Thermovirgaceae bacterium]|nr:methyltransferase [Thermovirgaceae bacterium]
MRTTRDAILYGELILDQPVDGPRVSVDTVLLSSYVKVRGSEKVIELGSAHGAISLLLARRFPSAVIEGLEIQPGLVAMARRNASRNGLQEKVSFREGDLKSVREFYPAQSFNAVVVNPPYDEAARSRHSPRESEAVARHGTRCTLQDVIRAAKYLLANRGKLFLVLRAKRAAELLSMLSCEHIEPKRIRPVYPSPGREASVILVQAIRAAGKGTILESPLFIQDAFGKYTPELLAAYDTGASKCP